MKAQAKNYNRQDATRVKKGPAWQYTILSGREAVVFHHGHHLVTCHDAPSATVRRIAQAVCAALDTR